MKFTVVWQQEAEDELARLWLAASERQLLSDAANRIDRELQHEPARLGKKRPDGSYELELFPLKIRFDVLPDDCRVVVLVVWLVPVSD